MNKIEWNYYNKFNELNNKWLPDYGEGENAGMQAVTAVNKLVYKWYNDGDVFDNTGLLTGWCNDLSSYANWLNIYVDGCSEILCRIFSAITEDDYEKLLKDLADLVLNENFLNELIAKYNGTIGSIYKCEGLFKFNEYEEDEEDWYEEDEEEEDE